MYRIFTELWATEFHHHLMNFSGTNIIKISTEAIPHESSTWNLDIVFFVNVCVRSLKIVCPQKGIILSQLG